jgi:hypothetical protein
MLRDVAPRRWLWIVGGLLAVGLVIVGLRVVFGVRWVLNPAAQHEQAIAHWQAAAVTDYRVWVAVEAGFSADGVYELTVQDGTVTDAAIYNTPTFRYDPDAPAFDVPASVAAAYTVESLLASAADLTDTFGRLRIYTPTTSHVAYNADLGYVERYVNNTCGWLVARRVGECITRVEVLRFEPSAEAG